MYIYMYIYIYILCFVSYSCVQSAQWVELNIVGFKNNWFKKQY